MHILAILPNRDARRAILAQFAQTTFGVDSMEKIAIAFLAAVSLAGFGCHKNKGKDNDKDNDREYLARLTEFKNKMCACPDKACSEKVSGEYSQWSQAHPRSEDQPGTPSAEDAKIEEVTEALKDCILKLEFPGGGSAAAGSAAAGGSGSPAAGSNGSAAAGGSGSPAAGSNGSAAAGW